MQKMFYLILTTEALQVSASVFVIANLSVRSPRNLFIFIFKNNLHGIKISQKSSLELQERIHW